MKSNKTIVIAIVLGVIAVYLVNSHVSELETKAAEPKVTFFQAAADIAPGRLVKEALKQKLLVPLREIPVSFAKHYPQAIDGDEYSQWADSQIVRAIPAGEFLRLYHVQGSNAMELARMIPAGQTTVTIAASQETAVGFLAAPGDLVDVYYTVLKKDPTKPGGQDAEVVPVAENMTIFAVDDYYGTKAELVRPRGQAYSSITLVGPRPEIDKVRGATRLGKLTLALPSQAPAQ